jgi:phosphohistidine phosphatase
MKTLILLRHAKTENGFDKTDINRNLTDKGNNDAALMALRLNDLKIVPQIIVSSNALRTQQTALIFLENLIQKNTELILNSKFYNADCYTIQSEINNLPNGFETVMIVCHNPGITDFANSINGNITYGLPPCGMVIFTFETDDWSNFFSSVNKLIAIIQPD